MSITFNTPRNLHGCSFLLSHGISKICKPVKFMPQWKSNVYSLSLSIPFGITYFAVTYLPNNRKIFSTQGTIVERLADGSTKFLVLMFSINSCQYSRMCETKISNFLEPISFYVKLWKSYNLKSSNNTRSTYQLCWWLNCPGLSKLFSTMPPGLFQCKYPFLR